MLQPGDLAPDVSARRPDGTPVRLSDLRGRRVAVFFYPKDFTPGCTKQACSLRDGETALRAAGVEVIGVSADSDASHARFAATHALPFALASDPDRALATAYGVWGEKSLYGRLVQGLLRTTFLVGEDGRVVDVIKRPNTSDHAAEVLRRFDAAAA